MIKTFVIIKVEHYGPMNLVSVHNTFKSALAEMKEAIAKKIDSAKAAHGEDLLILAFLVSTTQTMQQKGFLQCLRLAKILTV